MADPGATYDGASEFAGTCLQLLQKGCYAKVLVAEATLDTKQREETDAGKDDEESQLPDAAKDVEKSELTTVFARGGLESKTGDSPQRAGDHGFKNQTSKTEVPCGNCAVRQSNVEREKGGDLGDRNFDIIKHRRKRGELELGRSELEKLGFGTPQAAALSKKLGIVEPHPSMRDQPRLLWDLTSHHSPLVSEGPELLHLDFLSSCDGSSQAAGWLVWPGGIAIEGPYQGQHRLHRRSQGACRERPAHRVPWPSRIRWRDEALPQLKSTSCPKHRGVGPT